ncbi:cytosine permease [Lacisediminihabitans changchengi]|uniref:Cytosine permease n=1 Tax=Lacisediminihabitans changchengi TaxID=2787634 RepID=A0A934VX99_9MICO|nr:cytosine permease [Lacisediminihabitans changchengi]MBK4346682.1 cytosine permease [Lacisediminihabitans changchengi]
MASDDDAEESGIAEDPNQPQGPRRSTFTPPPSGATGERSADGQDYDDDALAAALAEQFAPFGSTGILPATPAALEDFPAPSGPPVVFGTDDLALPTEPTAPSAEELSRFAPPEASPTGPVWSPPGPTRQSYTPPAEFVDPELVLAEPKPEPTPEAAPVESAPVESAPVESAPVESAPTEKAPTEKAPADGVLPSVPERRSLADDELVRTLETEVASGSTLDAMTQLEEQLRLRQQDADDFDRWQSTMRSIGTPEAIDSIEAAIPTFTDVINLPTPDQLAGAEAPAQVWPARELHPAEPAADTSEPERAGEPEPESEADPETELEPESEPETEPDPDPDPEPAPEQSAPVAEPVVYELIEPLVTPTPGSGIAPLASLDLVRDSVEGILDPGVPHLDEVPAPTGREHLPGFDDLIGFDDLLSGRIRTVAGDTDTDTDTYPDAHTAPGGDPVETGQPEAGPLDPATPLDAAATLDARTPDSAPVLLTVDPVLPTVDPVLASAPVLTVDPVPTPAVPTRAVAERPQRTSVLTPERAGVEPTPMDQRVGRAARMFWLWFATNSSLISLAFGGVLLSLGMSLRQAVVAALIGVAISFLPLGLGTLAGKWSGQPTMIVSRASFGMIGNIVPASLAVITRVFWGAVLLWLLGSSTARILIGNRTDGTLFGLGETKISALAIAVGFVVSLAVAVLGYAVFSRVQLILSIVSTVLIVAFVAVSWHAVDVGQALTVGDGPWILVVTGVVLVVSFLGVVWATSSADLARYQRPSSSGAAAMLWAPFGATLPAFVLIAYGALLSASSPALARGLVDAPLDTIASLTPAWFPVPLLLATVLSLLVGVVLSIYSGGFALQAVGLRVPRSWSSTTIGVLVFVVALVLTLTVGSMAAVFRDLTTTIAVPVSAWIGIFSAEMILRRRRFDSASLLRRGGTYSDVNWVNLTMLVVASAIGFGLTTATVGWLGWQGYLFGAFGVPLDGQLAGTDVGVLVALVLGLLTPFVSGLPTIRKQERQPRYSA